MLLDRLRPSSKLPRNTRRNPSDSAVLYEAQSSTNQSCRNKRFRVPRKNPQQARNSTAQARAILKFQTQISMASPAIALSSTPNPIIVSGEAGHELLSTENDMILSSLITNDRNAPKSRKGRSDRVATSVLSDDSYLPVSEESDKRCKRKRGADGDLFQKRAKENPAEDIPRMESNLKSQTELAEAKAIDSETETKRLGTTHFGPHNKQESTTSLVLSNLVQIDDMDCATRQARLKILITIIERGDELTEVEKAQLAELEAKGTRVYGRDLSRINVANMDIGMRKNWRNVLRKKVDRYNVLNEAEMKQVKDFGMLLYMKRGK
ncbi:hypothetical protein HO133_005763 [Letharia lupina]|uniref:Uncharacterized protein n=1 Tax=Letharia lupina TaxID=560253 RepID=A0A8H6C7J1_9LECA|nr:uncharacterized protein HO133_005763 [Letharia lupina]KAF6218415.1 hypothetical protein HO133_005763 [Letharia lupina]